jgi:acyl carrier protein
MGTDILGGIAAVAREHLGWEGPLTGDMRLVEDLRLDSVRLLTLAAEVENRFRVVLDEADEVASSPSAIWSRWCAESWAETAMEKAWLDPPGSKLG